MYKRKRVVITGIGPVTSIGIGRKEFFDHLLARKINVRSIPSEYERAYTFKSRFLAPFPEFSLVDFVETKFERMMEKTSMLSVAATKLALQDADLTDVGGATVILGVGMPALATAFQSHIAHAIEGAPGKFNRMVIPMQMPNAASAWVSILFGAKGPQYTLNASCASGTLAIGEAFEKIAQGSCDTALTGGVECLADATGSIMRGFDLLTVLTKSADGLPRPFSKNRSGFLFSEGGGCVLILEELEKARGRKAPIYAEIVGYAGNSDAYNIVQMEESGSQIISLLRTLIGEHRIDYLNTHGTGTINNDETEAGIIREVFGAAETQPLINSTKGILGHSIGASGAIEAAVAALAIKEGRVHGNLTDDPLENLNLAIESRSALIESAVSMSFGFGGHNAALLLRKLPETEKA